MYLVEFILRNFNTNTIVNVLAFILMLNYNNTLFSGIQKYTTSTAYIVAQDEHIMHRHTVTSVLYVFIFTPHVHTKPSNVVFLL